MYIPQEYSINDREEMISFMKTYSFATVITVKDDFQKATHLPFVISQENDEIILLSHFAKANEQWEEITNNQVLVVFAEPHAYISPTHYESQINVPTWNYMAVHTYGKGEIIEGKTPTIAVLEMMINNYEKDYKTQWDNLPENYKNKLINEIVAFKIVVTEIKATKKISQNKRTSEKENIINSLQKSDNKNEKDIAKMMKKELLAKNINK